MSIIGGKYHIRGVVPYTISKSKPRLQSSKDIK